MDGMKTAGLGTALLLSLALLASNGVFAQEVPEPLEPYEQDIQGENVDVPPAALDEGEVVADEPLREVEGDVPEAPPAPIVGNQPDDPEAQAEVADETEAVATPAEEPVSPRSDQPVQVWGNLPPLEVIGTPIQGGVGYMPAASPVAVDNHWVSYMVHYIMLAIVLFVTFLVLYCIIRFNRKRNPTPAMFTHNTRIEVAWTLIPVLILIVIGSFALPLLFKQLDVPEADVTIKATGYQWFWGYEYPDYEFGYESFMLEREELEPAGYDEDYYLMATDAAMVVPVGKTIRMQVTGADVIHSWKVQSFGVHMDAIPGRLNEMWFRADQEGVYFGFCSELCGLDHTYMPITVKVVSEEAYEEWLDWAIGEFGGTRPEPEVAAVQ
jgi:cytochrome c oxidase subunit II